MLQEEKRIGKKIIAPVSQRSPSLKNNLSPAEEEIDSTNNQLIEAHQNNHDVKGCAMFKASPRLCDIEGADEMEGLHIIPEDILFSSPGAEEGSAGNTRPKY